MIPAPPYQMTAHEKKIVQKRAARRAARSPNMRMTGRRQIGPDHPNPFVGYELAFEEMGVDSDVGRGILNQMMRVSSKDGKADLERLNFQLSFVKSLKPRDALEAGLISQIALAQMQCMEVGRLAANVADPDWVERHERRLLQLMRIYVRQMEALKNYRSDGVRQTMVVEHVTVNHGAQAVIGNVTKHEASKQLGQLTQEKGAPMPPIEGDPVAVPSRKTDGDDNE